MRSFEMAEIVTPRAGRLPRRGVRDRGRRVRRGVPLRRHRRRRPGHRPRHRNPGAGRPDRPPAARRRAPDRDRAPARRDRPRRGVTAVRQRGRHRVPGQPGRRWRRCPASPSAAPGAPGPTSRPTLLEGRTSEPVSRRRQENRMTSRNSDEEVRPARAAQHPGDPHVLPHQRDAGVLRRGDRVQPARTRPLGAELPLHRVLRLVGRRTPAGVLPAQQAVCRVQEQRGDQQLPAPRSRGTGVHRPPRQHGQGGHGVLRRRDRGDLPRARLRADPAHPRAPHPAGLEAHHHPARQRGRCPERAERADRGRLLEGADERRHRTPASAPTWSSRRPTATAGRRPSSSPRRRTGTATPTTSSARRSRS